MGPPAKTRSVLSSFNLLTSVHGSPLFLLKHTHAVLDTEKWLSFEARKTYPMPTFFQQKLIFRRHLSSVLLTAISEVKTNTSQRCTPGKSIFNLTVGRFLGKISVYYPYPAVAEHPGVRGQSDKAFCHKVSKP